MHAVLLTFSEASTLLFARARMCAHRERSSAYHVGDAHQDAGSHELEQSLEREFVRIRIKRDVALNPNDRARSQASSRSPHC